jgi:hypothetical protein
MYFTAVYPTTNAAVDDEGYHMRKDTSKRDRLSPDVLTPRYSATLTSGHGGGWKPEHLATRSWKM